eukprot:TRINITY_DN14375_c0_g1_i1.p1 TRINITY_DN14375_c0_g1~~TRINITY_DN14375_c0_g1_i1.p1  ORF type:complete len:471 (+),score=154.61 TRINITY_DN14375_c0_g1_i1:48-1460(+)
MALRTVISKSNLNVGIVGAGLSGLCLAELLKVNGYDNVRVFDSDKHSKERDQGTSLDLSKETQEILKKTRVWEHYNDISRQGSNVFKCYDGRDLEKPLLVLTQPKFLEKIMPPEYETNREELRNCLIDKIGEENVQWDARINNIQILSNEKSIILDNQGNHYDVNGKLFKEETGEINEENGFDVVVDASGVRGALRKYIVNDNNDNNPASSPTEFDKEIYHQCIAYHGIINSPEESIPEAIRFFGEGSGLFILPPHVVCYQRFGSQAEDKRTSFYYFGMTKESQSLFINKKNYFTKDDPEFIKLNDETIEHIESTSSFDKKNFNIIKDSFSVCDSVLLRNIYHFPSHPNFRSDQPNSLYLIGDSLHALPPWSGAGGNLAIEDAGDVFDIIDDHVKKAKTRDDLYKSLKDSISSKMLKRSIPNSERTTRSTFFFKNPKNADKVDEYLKSVAENKFQYLIFKAISYITQKLY